MKEIFLLLGAFLVVAVNANGHVAYYPIEGRGGRGGSTCMIKSRSIEVDGEQEYGKQASINPGSIFIPNSNDDETYESEEDDEEPTSDDEYEDDDYDDDSGPPVYPHPVQYAGGYRPWPQASDPSETAVSVSSAPNFAPTFYGGGDKEKYKYKKKRGGGKGGKKKGGGNINCIIITKGGHHKHHAHHGHGHGHGHGHHHHHHKEKPTKLFGIFPIGGSRRSIARGLRALRN